MGLQPLLQQHSILVIKLGPRASQTRLPCARVPEGERGREREREREHVLCRSVSPCRAAGIKGKQSGTPDGLCPKPAHPFLDNLEYAEHAEYDRPSSTPDTRRPRAKIEPSGGRIRGAGRRDAISGTDGGQPGSTGSIASSTARQHRTSTRAVRGLSHFLPRPGSPPDIHRRAAAASLCTFILVTLHHGPLLHPEPSVSTMGDPKPSPSFDSPL